MRYSGDEILQMAEQIERNGRRFYLRAAECVEDEAAQAVLRELAGWEEKHETLFRGMRESLSGQEAEEATWLDPNSETALYLQHLAGDKVFRSDLDPMEVLPADASEETIFALAISMEKESVVTYTALRDNVPAVLGRGDIDAVIEEELKHIRILSAELAKRGGGSGGPGRYDRMS